MPILDFKEIKSPISSDGKDDWELFARDFFEANGFRIVDAPSRGTDGGKDLIIEETVQGQLTSSKKLWLVSCKHYAHSGKAIGPEIESNIKDRVSKFSVHGFIGFYSTIATSGLSDTLKGLSRGGLDFILFDKEKIESDLLHKEGLKKIAKKWFVISFTKWLSSAENQSLKKILSEEVNLNCDCCGADLLKKESSIVVFVLNSDREIEKLYVSCKGECDRILTHKYARSNGRHTSWQDIGDLKIPTLYLKWVISIINRLQAKVDNYSPEAFEKLKHILIALSQCCMLEPTEKQRERIQDLENIPDWL